MAPAHRGRGLGARPATAVHDHPQRQHRLKGKLGSTVLKGQELERRQYEVTGGGRSWYVIDPVGRTVWITYAGTGHPKATD